VHEVYRVGIGIPSSRAIKGNSEVDLVSVACATFSENWEHGTEEGMKWQNFLVNLCSSSSQQYLLFSNKCQTGPSQSLFPFLFFFFLNGFSLKRFFFFLQVF
jgi:hypothetical protein